MNFWSKLKTVWEDKGLRNRLLFVAFILLISRLLSAIPIPGIDAAKLNEFFSGSQFFSFLNIFSGGGMSRLSIVMLGVSPYITASIAMQLLTMVSGKLKSMYQEEGEAGRTKFNQISRMITVPIALIQAFGFLALLASSGIISNLTHTELIVNVIVITAGSMLFMWLGELMTEFGIGNGVSLLIFAGIVARLPGTITQLSLIFNVSQIPMYVLFAIFSPHCHLWCRIHFRSRAAGASHLCERPSAEEVSPGEFQPICRFGSARPVSCRSSLVCPSCFFPR